MLPSTIAGRTSGERSKVASSIVPSRPAASSAASAGAEPVGPSVRMPLTSGLLARAPPVGAWGPAGAGRGGAAGGHRVGEALAAQVERHVADLLVDAQRVGHAGRCHALTAAQAGFVLGLAHMDEDAQVLVDIGARVH